MKLFALDTYVRMLDLARDYGYAVYGIETYLVARKEQSAPKGKYIAIRHDVDWFPSRALAMAAIEANRNVLTTYYFRKKFFDSNSKTIGRIAGLDHQIGYHYEEADAPAKVADNKDGHAAGRFVNALLELERRGFPIRTVSAHCNPLTTVNDSQTIRNLRQGDISDSISSQSAHYEAAKRAFDRLIGDASIDLGSGDFDLYLPDTGRFNPRYNIKDHIDGCPTGRVEDLAAFESLLTSSKFPRLYLNLHPDRWSGNLAYWLFDLAFDTVKNLGKLISGRTRLAAHPGTGRFSRNKYGTGN